MTIALVVVLVFGITTAGGFDAVIENANKLPGYLSLTESYNSVMGTASDYGIITIISTLAWGLGYFGMPHILLRFMAIEDENKLKISRRIASLWVVISLGVAVFIAKDPNSSVFEIVSFAWAGFGAAFGPVVLFSLFWKRANKYGAFAGMLSGGIMVFVWKYLVRPMGGIVDVYELLPAFIIASIFIVVVSLLTPAPSKEIVDEFEKAVNTK